MHAVSVMMLPILLKEAEECCPQPIWLTTKLIRTLRQQLLYSEYFSPI